mmetsp:Transcript_22998/g.52738  ORF Transcript_22998/g.52738 Transcript_22998/m.52738 type:complete len:216 (+) Transcript_22998:551-1198(+)
MCSAAMIVVSCADTKELADKIKMMPTPSGGKMQGAKPGPTSPIPIEHSTSHMRNNPCVALPIAHSCNKKARMPATAMASWSFVSHESNMQSSCGARKAETRSKLIRPEMTWLESIRISSAACAKRLVPAISALTLTLCTESQSIHWKALATSLSMIPASKNSLVTVSMYAKASSKVDVLGFSKPCVHTCNALTFARCAVVISPAHHGRLSTSFVR